MKDIFSTTLRYNSIRARREDDCQETEFEVEEFQSHEDRKKVYAELLYCILSFSEKQLLPGKNLPRHRLLKSLFFYLVAMICDLSIFSILYWYFKLWSTIINCLHMATKTRPKDFN